MLKVRHQERLLFGGAFDPAAANALDADAYPLNGAVDFDLQTLKVRLEAPPADAGDLSAHAAQVFRFAAPGNLVPQARFLAANAAL
jgi:hypothetical protein